MIRSTERWGGLFAWSLPPSSLTQFENYQTYPTLSHFLSLVKRMMTSLGCIWYPSSLNDKFLPSKVTLIRYLQEREESKENINAWKPNPKWDPACPLQLTLREQEHSANNGKSKRKGVRKTVQLVQKLGQSGKAGQLPLFCDWDREVMYNEFLKARLRVTHMYAHSPLFSSVWKGRGIHNNQMCKHTP